MRKALSGAVAAVAVATSLMGMPAAQASTSAPPAAQAAGCSHAYNPYDPDQGSGSAWSYCSGMVVTRHRVLIWCNGQGPWYGHWAYDGGYSTTYCSGGEFATGSSIETQ